MSSITPAARRALDTTQATSEAVKRAADALALRWFLATTRSEAAVVVPALEEGQPPTREMRVVYRSAQSVPLTYAGLSTEQTASAVEAAVLSLRQAGWDVSLERSVVRLQAALARE